MRISTDGERTAPRRPPTDARPPPVGDGTQRHTTSRTPAARQASATDAPRQPTSPIAGGTSSAARPDPTGMYAPQEPATRRRCLGAATAESSGGAARITITRPSPWPTRAASSPASESTTAPARSAATIAARPNRICRPKPTVCPSHPNSTPPAAPRALTVERYQAAVAELSPKSCVSTGSAAAAPPIWAAATTPAPMRAATAPQDVRPGAVATGARAPSPTGRRAIACSLRAHAPTLADAAAAVARGAMTHRGLTGDHRGRTSNDPVAPSSDACRASRYRSGRGDGCLWAGTHPQPYAAIEAVVPRWPGTSGARGADFGTPEPDRPAGSPRRAGQAAAEAIGPARRQNTQENGRT